MWGAPRDITIKHSGDVWASIQPLDNAQKLTALLPDTEEANQSMASKFDRQTQFLSRWSVKLPERTRAVVSAGHGLSEETERVAATPLMKSSPACKEPTVSEDPEAVAKETARADQAERAYALVQARLEETEARLNHANDV